MKDRVTILTGGVGGAKLALGLCHAIPAAQVSAIVNTGDDFVHLGLAISPDLDTLLYSLSGQAHPVQGWGRSFETWHFLEAARSLGAEDWFALGDADLALHVLRTQQLRAGLPLSQITAGFARHWQIAARILPMSDDPVATHVLTTDAELDFQQYFVKQRCAPPVVAIRFQGSAAARPAPGVLAALHEERLRAILIAPSNPYLSIDPILAVPAIRQALLQRTVPVVAVSPLVGGAAVKGPTAKIMRELGLTVSSATIARHYGDLIDALVVDARDPPEPLEVAHTRTDTLMKTLQDRTRVAHAALELADRTAIRVRR